MSKPILYDFFATWCGPCRIQSPIVHELAEKLEGKADVRMIDVDKEPGLANQYEICVVPTLIIEKDGVVKHRLEGVTSAEKLESLLAPLF